MKKSKSVSISATPQHEKIRILHEKHEKYLDLVWLARKQPEDRKDKIINAVIKRVEYSYPKEVADLSSVEEGDWHHGFNSGMLAALRYVETLDSCGFVQAEMDFPMLDS